MFLGIVGLVVIRGFGCIALRDGCCCIDVMVPVNSVVFVISLMIVWIN